MNKINKTLATLVLAAVPMTTHALHENQQRTSEPSIPSIETSHVQRAQQCWKNYSLPNHSLEERARDLTCAHNSFDAALKENQNNLDALYGKADLLHSIGRFSEELPLLKRYATIKRDERVLESLAYAHANLGEFSEAQTIANEMIASNKNSAVGYQAAGWIASKQNKHDEALSLWGTALTLDPNNTKILNNMAFRYLKKKQPEMALSFLKKAIEIKPDYWNAHACLGDAYMQMHQFQSALTSYQTAERLRPGGYRADVERAQALVQK